MKHAVSLLFMLVPSLSFGETCVDHLKGKGSRWPYKFYAGVLEEAKISAFYWEAGMECKCSLENLNKFYAGYLENTRENPSLDLADMNAVLSQIANDDANGSYCEKLKVPMKKGANQMTREDATLQLFKAMTMVTDARDKEKKNIPLDDERFEQIRLDEEGFVTLSSLSESL